MLNGDSEKGKDRKLIRRKWVFKIKSDGTYRARLVALGYSQVPGADFTDKISIMEKVQTINAIWNKKEMKNGIAW